MSGAFNSLPNDVDSLKALVLEQAAQSGQLTERLQQTRARNTYLEARVLTLTEQLNLTLARRYAARSEKIALDQLRLFDEAEVDGGSVEIPGDEDRHDEADMVEIAAHQRKNRGHKPLPEALPRVEVIHDLAEDERIMPA